MKNDRKQFTASLGPIRITHARPLQTAYDQWWSAVCRQGDPIRMSSLTFHAFRAGWEARIEFTER